MEDKMDWNGVKTWEMMLKKILCHNVLEYVSDREEIMRQFARLLKPDGYISLVKHNRAGRVMQMTVLLNDFDHANSLLDGRDSTASEFGTIRYYEDMEVVGWCDDLCRNTAISPFSII